MHPKGKILFKETQRFTQWWIWLFLLLMAALPVYGCIQQLVLGRAWGNNPMSNTGLVLFTIGMFAFVYFFSWMQLDTIITKKGIFMKYRPFLKKFFSWEQIKSATCVTYSFVGYGIRYSSNGMVYNTAGNKGLELTLTNGKKYIIGTQKEEELKQMLTKIQLNN